MKIIPVPKEPGEIQELLNSGYDQYSINQRYKADLDEIRKEYSMMALLKGNANVVYCDDICDEPNPDGIGWTLYIRMELLKPLTKALAVPFSEAQVVKVGMDLCNALAACKRKNIIHRDIKPDNIMMAEDGHYKLGDFGIAKTMEGTSGGTKTGTYNFMAPEVYNNRPYGHSVDIYSLGMVLYWMMNQRCTPFLPLPPTVPTASQKENAKERRFGGEQLPPPANGSQALKQIVLRACAFDPAQRYATPEELYADLDEISKTQHKDHSYSSAASTASSATSSAHSTMGDQSNSWENEYDKTQGSVYGSGGSQGGTVGGTAGGKGSQIGPFDIRGQLRVTAQELAFGCVKTYITGSGKPVTVHIRAGTTPGTVLRLTGAGKQDASTGAKGDAYIALVPGLAAQQDIWGAASGKTEKKSTYSGVISTGRARNGGIHHFRFKDGKSKAVQIPAGCKDGQVVDGVTVYVHDFSTKTQNMEKLPDAVLEMYAAKSTGFIGGILFAFAFWIIFGISTMLIPVLAVGITVHVVFVFVRGIKRQQIIDQAAAILKSRQLRQKK